ncbi:ribbon-helix-helix domain-containing protein [Cohaesibacter gelatinilyticus]|uniref:Predicted DNA-binding protein, contains Ribbon-helix-helix (RHH) domain n=1 Tax=Cohaesibacter gelatinilyticus TaxID=372072 RepID=A0A285PC13_9HYPH|nr:ribbon-helix-helix domain-containing protein [Cohaesibacter gelatinilyticus]SNZ19275.1 Predicted DNA-binding protein, contains Ribbon-helix-helix (RHH) domain [Cohaesibacter gelatinilyticus]HAT84758.1 intracellular proteinase i [Hyphomicrobiales bacterium]
MCQLFIDADPALWTPQTRSFRMDGMVTSVRLEDLFWRTLETIGERDDLTVPQLLLRLYNESLDAGHDIGNFTSFLRVCCLRFLDLQLRGLIPVEPGVRLSELLVDDILAAERCERDKRAPLL